MNHNIPIMPKTKVQNKPKTDRVRLGLLLSWVLVVVMVFPGFLVHAEEPTPSPKPPLSSGFTRSLQGIFGLNALAGIIASEVLEKQIRKKVTGDLHVKLRPYSAMDLASGKARRLVIDGSNLIYDEAFYVSEFHLQTDDNTPIWIDLDSGKLKSPITATVKLRIEPDDLNRSFETPTLQEKLQHIKVPLGGMGKQTVALMQPHVNFRPDRIRFRTSLGIAGDKSGKLIPLDIETGLEPLTGNKLIGLKDVTIAPIDGVPQMSAVENFLEVAFQRLLNPSKLLPLDDGKLEIKSITISDEELIIKGQMMLVPPSHRQAPVSGVQLNKVTNISSPSHE
jgi:hypothetical protein